MTILKYQSIPVIKPCVSAKWMKPMELFRTVGYDGLGWYMRITPTGFLTKSRTVKENMERDNIFVVDISTGKFAILDGDVMVVRAKTATLTVE